MGFQFVETSWERLHEKGRAAGWPSTLSVIDKPVCELARAMLLEDAKARGVGRSNSACKAIVVLQDAIVSASLQAHDQAAHVAAIFGIAARAANASPVGGGIRGIEVDERTSKVRMEHVQVRSDDEVRLRSSTAKRNLALRPSGQLLCTSEAAGEGHETDLRPDRIRSILNVLQSNAREQAVSCVGNGTVRVGVE